MLNCVKYRLYLLHIALHLAAISVALTQEKPLPPLLEMMSRIAKPSAAMPSTLKTANPTQTNAKKGLPPLEILSQPTAKSEEAIQTDKASSVSDDNASVSNDKRPDMQTKRKLLTLRNQLQTIEGRQQEQNITNEDLRKEISEIKRSVDDLKLSVEAISNNVKKQDMRIAVPSQVKETQEKQHKSISRRETEENIILPDGGKKKAREKAEENSAKISPSTKESLSIKNDKKQANTDTPAEQSAHRTSQYIEAMNLISKKKYEEAIPLLQQTLQNDKNLETQSGCYYWLGESNYGLGKYDEAIKNFQKVNVLKSSSKLPDAQLMIAESYYRKGDVSSAKSAYQRLINVFPKSAYIARAKKMLQEL